MVRIRQAQRQTDRQTNKRYFKALLVQEASAERLSYIFLTSQCAPTSILEGPASLSPFWIVLSKQF